VGSKLYGKVTGDKGESTRASQHVIETWIQTERGRITVTLNAAGDFEVFMGTVRSYEPHSTPVQLCKGNVNEQHALPTYWLISEQRPA
jgi:hypothetical protein